MSIDCARVMRGISSSAKAVTPLAASASTSARLVSAPSGDIRTWPLRSKPSSSAPSSADIGRWILNTMSPADAADAASGTIFAPASRYAWSV
jgi:hypothetical protein